MCNWCRSKPGDIFCDGWPACFDCIEIMIDKENAVAMHPRFREDLYVVPWGWERD